MSALDWVVLVGTIVAIVAYGARKTREVKTADTYLRGGRDMKWWTIGLSIMATQASAITFLSMPGQAYEDGMGFVQFYLGLPIAMVILSATIVPIYYRLKVYTAYEYLEGRFDLKTRQLTALLFFLSRGLAAGISIYAPAIVLSTVLGWSLNLTNLVIGVAVILYTVSGGTRAVSRTQTWQMGVMLGGIALAFVFIVRTLPQGVTFNDALHVAGSLGRMNVVDFSPRLDTRYTIWSGLTGGLFVQLAYFGTDQSQVQRYLSGSTLAESRMGMLLNGLVKLPMQFLILSVGLMVFVHYQFQKPPVFFNAPALARAKATGKGEELRSIESAHDAVFAQKRQAVDQYVNALHAEDASGAAIAKTALQGAETKQKALRNDASKLIGSALAKSEAKDSDYIFLSFVTKEFPSGLLGLLLAVIFCAAMSATAAALNALGSTTVVDFYRRSWKKDASDAHYLGAAKLFTVFWGVVAMLFATFASLVDNLIQAVNILGSIFYGPMLGVFLVGFFFRRVRGTAAFAATLSAQAIVVATALGSSIGYLWYNVIGCAAVVVIALGLQAMIDRGKRG